MASDTLLHFVETLAFRKRLDKLADLNTLFAIQADLLENPKCGVVIKGCGGARKARVADFRGSRGKSGGLRYIYLYLERSDIVYLFMLYPKHEKSDLSGNEKKILAALVKQYKDLYGEK